MLAMKILEKPRELMGKIITLKAQIQKLEDDYENKFRGEIYSKRRSQLMNKVAYYKNALNRLGVESFVLWYVEVTYLDDMHIGPTEFEIRLNSIYDESDIEALVQMKFNCIVNSYKKLQEFTCGEIIQIKPKK